MSCAAESNAVAAASEGTSVVRLGTGKSARYELDEEALRRVLLRRDVQDLPVVVVSVAGAYRGGKSFILDFFLRYLTAPRCSQLSGEWLGKENEQLKGFHWRGGCERDTTGIHLWPEPIVTTLNNGEKVAVLLMDTQGTFDSESTIGQNSTIFALSTLISSVQIYNISLKFREDDLQHLQLFTQYGMLAYEGEGKAFQTLLFLVRDWACAYEHAHGFSGGATLLKKWLQIPEPPDVAFFLTKEMWCTKNACLPASLFRRPIFRYQLTPNQKPELREVREHIRSCFDSIKCFLMPYPGSAVENQNFAGCISDLKENFRSALLQLVPALFDPKHLTPKLINGERVRTQDLFDYFRKYVDIYNSDEVPEVTTIFKATADACLLAAARAASNVYRARMEERVNGSRSLSRRKLADAHTAALAEAEQVYAGKKKLGSKKDAEARLQELTKELDASQSLYVLNNDATVRETISLARESYDAAVSSVCGDHARLCLHPGDLEELHAEALQKALTIFDSAREAYEDEEDEQRTTLVESLVKQYDHLCVINEQNNKSAVQKALDVYVTRMRQRIDQSGVSSHNLRAQNQSAREDATEFFVKQRDRISKHKDDPYVKNLDKEIESKFAEFEQANDNRIRVAMQMAELTYNNYITSEWGSRTYCLHPQDLENLHKRAVDAAIKAFNQEGGEEGYLKIELVNSLVKQYDHLCVINEQNNKSAVQKALDVYVTRMRQRIDQSGVSSHNLRAQNQSAREDATEFFVKQRGRISKHKDDPYVKNLDKEIESKFAEFEQANDNRIRDAMQMAELTYNNYITSEWGSRTYCLHPQALENLHKRAVDAAIKAFNQEGGEEGYLKIELVNKLEQRHLKLVSDNNYDNNQAVERAFQLYKTAMDSYTKPVFVCFFYLKLYKSLPGFHENTKQLAINDFLSRRHGAQDYGHDTYLEHLKQKIRAAYAAYKFPVEAILYLLPPLPGN